MQSRLFLYAFMLSIAAPSYAGVTISPTTIRGNEARQVRLCATDAIGTPLPGRVFAYSRFVPGTIDGSTAPDGNVASVTAADGCVNVAIETWGVVQTVAPNLPWVTFRVAIPGSPQQVEVNMTVWESAVLVTFNPASPVGVMQTANPATQTVEYTLTRADNQTVKIRRAIIDTTCAPGTPAPASVTANPQSATTSDLGVATVSFSYTGMEQATSVHPSVSCTVAPKQAFGQNGTSPTTLTFRGTGICAAELASRRPQHPLCTP